MLQMHADACGLAVVVCECADGPLLGCAVLAGKLLTYADVKKKC